jgi:hypothetical protein
VEPAKSPPPGTTTGAQNRPALGLTLPKGIKLRSALRKGLAVTVKSGAAGRVTATVKLKRSNLGSGAVKVGASGKAKLRIRFTPKASRLLHHRRSVRVTIAFRFTPAQGAAVRRSVSLTLKR